LESRYFMDLFQSNRETNLVAAHNEGVGAAYEVAVHECLGEAFDRQYFTSPAAGAHTPDFREHCGESVMEI